MDLGNPGSFFSGLLIGLIGMAIFIYGKKQLRPMSMAAGAALCVFPYFVASVAMMWTIAGVCLGGLYYHSKHCA